MATDMTALGLTNDGETLSYDVHNKLSKWVKY